MQFTTRQQLINDVVTEIGLVSGTSVQLFTEDQIESKLYDAFDTLAKKRFWPHLTKNTTHGLDGSSGTITDTLSLVHSVEDIEWIREYPYEPLNKINFLAGEPYINRADRAYDTREWDATDYATKLITVYPLADDTSIMIRARRTPTAFNTDSDIIPLDRVAMKHFLAFLMFSIDGINAEASATELGMFESRYNDLIHGESREPSKYGRKRRWAGDFTVAGT